MNARYSLFPLACLVLLTAASQAVAVTLQLVPDRDTFIDARYNSNYDSRTGMEIGCGGGGGNDIQRTLMSFDLSSLYGWRATGDGILHLSFSRGLAAGTDVSVYEMSEANDDWLETQASWIWKNMSPQVAWDGGSHDAGKLLVAAQNYAGTPMNIAIPQEVINRWLFSDPDRRVSLVLLSNTAEANRTTNNYGLIRPKNLYYDPSNPYTPLLSFDAVTPEPQTLLLLLAGAAAIPLFGRRRGR